MQDVRTERDIRKQLEVFPLMEHEWDYYHMDQRINDRGVLIDKKLVEQAIACDLMLSDAMTKKAYKLTGLENPNSVSQLKTWLQERGIEIDSLGRNFTGRFTYNEHFIWLGKRPFEREKLHGKAGKPCKYVLFEADVFPTPTVVVLPVLS